VDHPDLVELNQHAQNKQGKLPLAIEIIFTSGSNWHELHGMSPDVAMSGTDFRLSFANKTSVNRHRNAKFVKVFTRERNPLYGSLEHLALPTSGTRIQPINTADCQITESCGTRL